MRDTHTDQEIIGILNGLFLDFEVIFFLSFLTSRSILPLEKSLTREFIDSYRTRVKLPISERPGGNIPVQRRCADERSTNAWFSFFIILAEILAVGSYGSFRDDLKTEVYLIEVGSWKTLEDFPFD